MELLLLALLFVAYMILDRRRSDERYERLLELQRQRENELLDRIQAPSVAAAQSLTERAAVDVSTPTYVSAFDDEQWQEYEATKQRLEHETRELIGEFVKDSSPGVDS